jgi:hypothetical protein
VLALHLVLVTPSVSTTYSVTGTNLFGCSSTSSQFVNVNPLPIVTASSSPAISCAGSNVALTGGGAINYQWAASSVYLQGSQINVSPVATTIYSLTGTDANGCSKIDICAGLGEVFGSINGLSIYPNPSNDMFTVNLSNGLSKTIDVIDVAGRIVLSKISADNAVIINTTGLANGIYYVKVKTDNAAEIIKVVKQ